MPPRAPRRTEGTLPPVFCTSWHCLGSAGKHRGSTTLWGYNAVASAAGMHRGCLCARRDTSRLPPHAHILYYMQYLFFIQPNGDASRVPPLTWGCIVDASVDQGLHFLQSSPLLAHALSTGTAPQRAQFQPHTEDVEVATLCTRPLLLRTRSGSLS